MPSLKGKYIIQLASYILEIIFKNKYIILNGIEY